MNDASLWMCSTTFANCAPAAIHAQLLDEGRYLASVRTMYRLLQSCAAVRERRNQLRHPESLHASPASRHASALSPTRAPTAQTSSPGTTSSIVILASAS
jgi:hypothetical protein